MAFSSYRTPDEQVPSFEEYDDTKVPEGLPGDLYVGSDGMMGWKSAGVIFRAGLPLQSERQ